MIAIISSSTITITICHYYYYYQITGVISSILLLEDGRKLGLIDFGQADSRENNDDNAERGGASSKGRAGVGTMAPSDEVSECRACGVLVSGATGECMQREGDDDRR